MAEPDQGWASWLNQVRQHQPNTPIPPDAPTGTPSTPNSPVATGPKDSTPAIASGDVQPAAPDAQHFAASASAPAPAMASALAAAAASVAPADSGSPMTSAPPPVSSVFSDSTGAQPLMSMSGGGSVFASDAGGDGAGLAQYASYGWYIVPSIGNDPGHAEASAGDSGGDWGYADAGYATDWFFV